MNIGDGIYRVSHNSSGVEDWLIFFVKETSPDNRGFMLIFYGGNKETLYHKDRIIEEHNIYLPLKDMHRVDKQRIISRLFSDRLVEWK